MPPQDTTDQLPLDMPTPRKKTSQAELQSTIKSARDIMRLEFPLPPRSVQDETARTLDTLSTRIDTAHADPALDSLRPSILNAAFTGQL